jgi:hypothetical protein
MAADAVGGFEDGMATGQQQQAWEAWAMGSMGDPAAGVLQASLHQQQQQSHQQWGQQQLLLQQLQQYGQAPMMRGAHVFNAGPGQGAADEGFDDDNPPFQDFLQTFAAVRRGMNCPIMLEDTDCIYVLCQLASSATCLSNCLPDRSPACLPVFTHALVLMLMLLLPLLLMLLLCFLRTHLPATSSTLHHFRHG